jgi:hypothetical protein
MTAYFTSAGSASAPVVEVASVQMTYTLNDSSAPPRLSTNAIQPWFPSGPDMLTSWFAPKKPVVVTPPPVTCGPASQSTIAPV